MIDQRKLPAQEVYVRCKTAAEVARAIRTMVIRGAPAIGVAAAMGIALGMRRSTATGTQKFAAEFYKICELMAATRPTAVNLFWAIERMKRSFAAGVAAGESVDQIKDRLDREAEAIHDEDVASCRAMGAFGAEVVPAEATYSHALQRRGAGHRRLRHRAGRRFAARSKRGKRVTVFADETRPFLQGARLTAWELVRDGIDTTVITDNMAGAHHAHRAHRSGRGRRRPDCGERRYGQQDWHLHASPCWRASTTSRFTWRRHCRRST